MANCLVSSEGYAILQFPRNPGQIQEACTVLVESAGQQTRRLLRKFGVRWPREPSKLRIAMEIARTDWLLRGPLDERLFPNSPPDDVTWLAPLYLIEAGGSALCKETAALTCFAASYSIRMQRRYGPMLSPGFALGSYAGFRTSATLNPRGSLRYARAAEDWMKRAPHRSDVRGELCLQAFVYMWLKPRRDVLTRIQRVTDSARELGDIEFSGYAARIHADYSLLCGKPLAETLNQYTAMTRQDTGQSALYYSQSFLQLYALLRDEETAPDAWVGALDDARRLLAGSNDQGIYVFWNLWASVLCYLGEYRAASELAEQISKDIFVKGASGSSVVDYTLIRGLAAFAEAETTRGRIRRRHLQVARRCERRLRRWVSLSPDFPHMSQFLKAESARASRRDREALNLYADATRRALDQGYTQHAALLCERRGELLLRMRRGLDASTALREASALYAEWGAIGKAKRLTLEQ